jgi:hypothetical protein
VDKLLTPCAERNGLGSIKLQDKRKHCPQRAAKPAEFWRLEEVHHQVDASP